MKALTLRFALVLCGWIPAGVMANAQTEPSARAEAVGLPTLGVCFPAPSERYSGENLLSPITSAEIYWRTYKNQKISGAASITVLQQPRRGVVRLVTEADRGILFSSTAAPVDSSTQVYAYLPEKDYLGKDSATLLVDIGGRKVKIVYFLEAIQGPLGNTGWEDLCSETGLRWRISVNPDAEGSSTVSAVDDQLAVTRRLNFKRVAAVPLS